MFVTGANGFVGSRLVSRMRRDHPGWTIHAATGPDATSQTSLDITNMDAVTARIVDFAPDLIVHLAAMASVPAATLSPRRAFEINLGGTLNVVEALKSAGDHGRLLLISTAEVYGRSLLEPGPHNEKALLQPTNAYASSKAAADILVRQAAITGLKAIIARPFNHIGAGQSLDFVIPSLCNQIAAIEILQNSPIIKVGSLDDERDFLHVEDVVDAYACLVDNFDQHVGGVFNIASGTGSRIGDLLDVLLSMSSRLIRVEVDPQRLRPGGVTRIIGDAELLKTATGWRPSRTVYAALVEVLAAERAAVGRA